MTVLSILRHAKSSWDEAGASDFDRPLNDRGRKAAERVGRELKRRAIRFDHVLASPAARVRETLELLASGYGALPPVVYEDQLFAASERTLLELVRSLPGKVHAPLLVGHNPGLHALLLELTKEGKERRRAVDKFPTAAFATIMLPAVRWGELGSGTGRLQALILPRELS